MYANSIYHDMSNKSDKEMKLEEESHMENHITLYAPIKTKKSEIRPGVIRVQPEALQVLEKLSEDSGLSVCKVASEMILQGQALVQIVECDE